MSKLMRDLKDAEQRRKSEDDQLAADRDGEAAALAWLAGEASGTARATDIQETQREAQEVARRRADAEAAAIEQARVRLKADIAARAMTLERVALERGNERLAQQRLEAEELALAEARRRELALSDLRDAVAARLERETQAREAAEKRAASEEAALRAANDKLQMERSIEATALSRAAAEHDATQLAQKRAQRQAEAAKAEVARCEAEAQLRLAAEAAATVECDRFDQPTVMGDYVASEVAGEAAPPHSLSWQIAAVAAVLVLGIALGWLGAEQYSATAVPKISPDLRFDADVEAFGLRAAKADYESSLRLVSPRAIQ
jgi:hypothetical protein